MLIAVLVSALILATVLCFYVPVPLIFSLAVGGFVWWLFLGYRNVLAGRSMSGGDLNSSRSGLLEGYGYRNRGKGSPSPIVPNERREYDVRRTFDSREYGSPIKVGTSPRRLVRLSSGIFCSPTPSPRVSSMSASRDEPFSPFSSPSVSSLISKPSYMENLSYRSDERRATSPMLPPGSYPWIMPHNGSATNKRLSLEAVPVKIKVSKPTSSFKPAPEVQEDESIKADKSLQIIQALKALSRKRLHTTGSDDEADDSGNSIANAPKRRPLDFHQNLYASQLASSDSSFPEIQEETHAEHRSANGSDSFNYSNVVTTKNAVTPTNNVVATTNNMTTLANNVVSQTNKRPRAVSDNGNQLSKRRNNEILSSLSSSLALLDPTILQRPRKRRENDAIPSKRLKTLETLRTSVEVQTLPSPILKDDTTKKKEDKGTATDKLVESGITYNRSTPQITAQSIPEKKVTGKMAAALYKSAMMKFANSGELLKPDTSATSTSILCDTSLSKSDVSVPIAQTGPSEASKPAEVSVSFGKVTEVPNTVGSAVSNGTLTMTPLVESSDKVDKPSVAPSSLVFGSGATTQGAFPSIGGSNDPNQAPPAPVKSIAAPATTAVASTEKPSGFTLGTAGNTMAITPSPPDTSKIFTFGSSTVAASKSDTTPSTAVPTTAPVTSKPAGAAQPYTFGALPGGDNKPVFTFGTPGAVVTSSAPNAPASAAPAGLSTAPSMTAAPKPTFTFGQNSSAGPSPLQQEKPNNSSSPFKLGAAIMGPAVTTASSGQTPTTESKPGGFPFPPTAKFNFGTPHTPSTTVASTTSSAQPTQQILSFGSGFSQKPEAGPKTLFGMPPPPATTSASAVVPSSVEPPKLFGSLPSGFSFNQSVSKEQPKMTFPSAPGVAKPEEKKQESFVFGGQKPEPSKLFAFGAQAATTEPPKPAAPAFAFGAGASAPPAFGSFSGKPAESTAGSMFSLPATTTSSLFGSTGTPTAASGFGSTASKPPLSFGASATTAPATGFGTSTITTSANPTPTFGSGLTSMGSTVPSFGSPTPAFGSSAPAFGSMTFGSGSSGFGSTNPPTFGSVAAVPSAPTTATPSPAFGSSATPQFGSGAFGSTAAPAVPSFGSSFPSTPSFGAPQTTSSAPFNFSAPTTPAAPSASGGYNFQPPGQQPMPMFQFSASSTPAQPAAAPPFSFGAGAPAAPGIGGFPNTMFSIGSGSSTPRSRMTSRSRKK